MQPRAGNDSGVLGAGGEGLVQQHCQRAGWIRLPYPGKMLGTVLASFPQPLTWKLQAGMLCPPCQACSSWGWEQGEGANGEVVVRGGAGELAPRGPIKLQKQCQGRGRFSVRSRTQGPAPLP